MKEVSHLVRKAFTDLIKPFVIELVTIPIFDGLVNTETVLPSYRSSTSAYILITDQNEVETTRNQCTLDQTATITFDCVVKYPVNYGGMLASELIANQLQQEVIGFQGTDLTISDATIKIQRISKTSGRSFTEQGATLTSFRKRLTFSLELYQSQ